MIKRTLYPSELFTTMGETMGKVIEGKSTSLNRYRVSKLTMAVQLEMAPDLKSLHLPSNNQKGLDRRCPTNLFKVIVNAR